MTEEQIIRLYGERCAEHCDDCCVCEVWAMHDLIETQAREIERLRERVERMGRDKETLLTFARAIQTWRSDADSYDEECDHPQRDYCEDVELMEKAAGYALRRIAERAALAGDSHDQ